MTDPDRPPTALPDGMYTCPGPIEVVAELRITVNPDDAGAESTIAAEAHLTAWCAVPDGNACDWLLDLPVRHRLTKTTLKYLNEQHARDCTYTVDAAGKMTPVPR